RFYGDLGWKGTDAEVHLVASSADNFFGVIGPTPVQLLNNDYRSIFTWPQTTRNQAELLALNGRYDVTDHWIVQSNLYVRKFQQAHVNGNGAEVERCSGNQANSLFNPLCLENDGFPASFPQAGFQILNLSNQPIPCPQGSGNTCAATPWGTVDRTWTNALTSGGTLQATNDDKILGHDNYFTIGGSIDHSNIGFQANSELGYVFPDLFVGPTAVPGTGQIIHTAADLGFSPVSLDAQNTYYGLYTNETFNVTPRLSLTAGARYNLAKIVMADLLGTSPDINGNHTFSRLNPVVGLTYKILPDMTFYTGYSEANRAPTPLELACSNPQKPCLLEGFLVSDPTLQQVVARTKEAGLRGNVKLNSARWTGNSGCSEPTARTTSSRSQASSRAAACSRTSRQPVDRVWRQERSTKPRHGSSISITGLSMPPISLRVRSLRPTIRRRMPMEMSSSRPVITFPAFHCTRSRPASTTRSRPH